MANLKKKKIKAGTVATVSTITIPVKTTRPEIEVVRRDTPKESSRLKNAPGDEISEPANSDSSDDTVKLEDLQDAEND